MGTESPVPLPPAPVAIGTDASSGFADEMEARTQALAADLVASTVPGSAMRAPVSLVSLGIVLFLAGLAGWWAQDVIAPFVNDGEASMSQTITFRSRAGTYRVVTSGPGRPLAEDTACDVVHPNESTERLLDGAGSGTAHDRFGVSRVLEFDTQAGVTRVTCENRLAPDHSSGRFQIVEADGVISKVVTGSAIAGAVSCAAGVLWLVARRRQVVSPAA